MKFMRGDIVKFCDTMPSYMSHFDCGYKALVEEVNGNNVGLINLKTGRYSAWYQADQLTWIKRIKEETIAKTKAKLKPIWEKREERNRVRSAKAFIKIITSKKKYPEGSIARMFQDAWYKTCLQILEKMENGK